DLERDELHGGSVVPSKRWRGVCASRSTDEQKNAGELHQLDCRERGRLATERHPESIRGIDVLRTEDMVSGSDAFGVGSGELRQQRKRGTQQNQNEEYGFHARD